MATYTVRSDADVDRALEELGATNGSRSRIIREAILAMAAFQREGEMPPSVVRDFTTVAQIQRDLDNVKSLLNRLMMRREDAA